MTQEVSLAGLRPGERARVRRMELRGGMRRRLRDMGMLEGAQLRCLLESPGGDPKAFLLRGAVIALRASDSERITVEPYA